MVMRNTRSGFRSFAYEDGRVGVFVEDTEREIVLKNTEFNILSMMNRGGSCNNILKEYPEYDEAGLYRLKQIFTEKGLLDTPVRRKRRWSYNGRLVIFRIYCRGIPAKLQKMDIELLKAIIFLSCLAGIVGIYMISAFVYPYLLQNSNRIELLSIQNIMLLSATILSCVSLHELGHALVIEICGGHVVQFDVGFISLFPSVSTIFVGCGQIKLFSKRFLINMAGIAVNFYLAFIFILLWTVFRVDILLIPGLFNISLALFNLMIFLKTDGRQILMDALFDPVDTRCGHNADMVIFDRFLACVRLLLIICMFYTVV